ncbi:MAG: D-2-hydroxyacid dehydrogenase family protein, partial [Actinobacteria bacterium]|nr:D-2-hydroxyacid dehydrogenase family protein [Actinomycetota bacterium]
MPARIAVLDDYQRRASGYADWAKLGGDDVDVVFFHDPIAQEALADRLADFDVLVLMRERTAFRRPVL